MERDFLELIWNLGTIGGCSVILWVILHTVLRPVLMFHVTGYFDGCRQRIKVVDLRSGYPLRRGLNCFYVVITSGVVRYMMPGNSFNIAQSNPENVIFLVNLHVKKGRIYKFDYHTLSKQPVSLDWQSVPIGNPMRTISA